MTDTKTKIAEENLPDSPGADELANEGGAWWPPPVWPWRRKKRKLTRRLVVILLLLNAGVVAGVIYLFSHDPGTTPQIEAFYQAPPPVVLEDNGWAALAGLDAPADEDMVRFGVAKLRSYLDDKPPPQYKPVHIDTFDLNRIECWYLPYIENAKRTCMPAAELERVLSRNSMMLQRYERLYEFPVFDAQPKTEFRAPVNTLKELHELQMARIAYLVSMGKNEDALALWIREMNFQRNFNLSQMTALDMDNRLAMLERSARLLPHIIAHRRDLVHKNYDDLLGVLSPPGRDIWPFADTIRNEGILWLRRIADGAKRFTTDDGRVMYRPVKINIFKRKYYKYAQALARAYEYPTGEGVQMAIAAVQKDYNNTLFRGVEDLSSPPQSIISNFMMSNIVSTAHLLGRLLQREELLRMLTAFVMAEEQGVTPQQMPDFLSGLPPELHSTMTGRPYEWDAQKGLIYSTYFDRLINRDVSNYVRIGTSPDN